MQIRKLTVERFRGIRFLDWQPGGRVICLIGPGDSTKTTILDAIEYALTSRWTVPVTDADLYSGTYTGPVEVAVTVGELPDVLRREDKFGLELRGWHAKEGLRDEPEEGDEGVLTIRWRVDEALEPSWTVINERQKEPRIIGPRDREAFGIIRLGGDVERQLSWARGSALSRQTERDEDLGQVLADAHRQARLMVKDATLPKLREAADRVREAALKLGARVLGEYHPALETGAGGGIGPLSLHEDDLPVRARGLGSRRLVALALQSLAIRQGEILLIDEVEHGLEPHRIRHLLRVLGAPPAAGAPQGQIFMTTHSPVPIEELEAEQLRCVQSVGGVTLVVAVPKDLQPLVRQAPSGLLARRTLVCEGRTEVGLCRGLAPTWAQSRDNLPLAHTGTELVDGGGNPKAAGRALELAKLGYATALFADSDKKLEPDRATLEGANIVVIQWAGTRATEEAVAADLPWPALQELLKLGAERKGEQSVTDSIRARLETTVGSTALNLDEWIATGVSEADLRAAIGKAAKAGDWFTLVEPGEKLGRLVGSVLGEISETDLAKTVNEIGAWCYGG
jgi:hypothetical protein